MSTHTLTQYLTLTKPRVVLLMMVTAWVGMFLGKTSVNSWMQVLWATLGITLSAASAAVINQCVERHIDAKMKRTQKRPLIQGTIDFQNALIFASVLGLSGLLILWITINPLTTVLTFVTLIGYAFFYTLFLKKASPQNIVIGGAAGAAPPLLGWIAMRGALSPEPFLLMLIIYVWTPPHFWALAIHRLEDYQKANLPMLPVTHGIPYTTLNILLYTIWLVLTTYLPVLIGMSGLVYTTAATLLNMGFLYYAIVLHYKTSHTHIPILHAVAMQTFSYSILYLTLLFFWLILDHCFFYPI